MVNDDFLLPDDILTLETDEPPYSLGLDPPLPPALRSPAPATPINPWSPRLVMDLAVGVDPVNEILDSYGLDFDDLERLMNNPTFRRELASLRREVAENGTSFRSKARMQAESYLSILDDIVLDTNAPTSTRLEGIKSAVRWADLEPKKSGGEEQPATSINVQINF